MKNARRELDEVEFGIDVFEDIEMLVLPLSWPNIVGSVYQGYRGNYRIYRVEWNLVDLFRRNVPLSLLYHAIVEAACVCHGAYFAANNAVITSRCQGTHGHFQLYDDNGASLVSL